MDRLSAVLTVLLLLCAPVAAQAESRWSPFVAEASARFGVPEGWIRRVIAAESGGRTHLHGRPIRSHAGAMGLMQLMPGTWAEVRARLGLGHDPDDPRDNILAGTFYLRAMHVRFGYPGLFAAYNAGPARYARHVRSGMPLPGETVAYVARVAGRPSEMGPARRARVAQTTMFARRDRPPGSERARGEAGIFFPVGQQAGERSPADPSEAEGGE